MQPGRKTYCPGNKHFKGRFVCDYIGMSTQAIGTLLPDPLLQQVSSMNKRKSLKAMPYKPLRQENCSIPKQVSCSCFVIDFKFSGVLYQCIWIPHLCKCAAFETHKPRCIAIRKSGIIPVFF